jgi:hypothetical protein
MMSMTNGAHAIQAERTETRDGEWNVPGDIPQRIAALVTVRSGVGQFAAADAVEHDEDDAGKRVFQSQEFGAK